MSSFSNIFIVYIQRINNYEMVNEGMNSNANIGQRFNPNEIGWPQSNLSSQHSQAQYMHPNNGYGFSTFPAGSSSMGSQLPNSPLNYNNLSINPDNNLQHAAAASALASMKGYTLINVPASRNQQLGTTASSSAAASAPRGAAGIPRPHGYPYKRCTNYNCNTNDTPMWRRGPLGPKVSYRFSLLIKDN